MSAPKSRCEAKAPNSRWLAYCRVHGKSEKDMLAHDEQRFPGGKMTGFITWLSAQWEAWRVEHGHPPDLVKTREHHAHFDAWLAAATAAPPGGSDGSGD